MSSRAVWIGQFGLDSRTYCKRLTYHFHPTFQSFHAEIPRTLSQNSNKFRSPCVKRKSRLQHAGQSFASVNKPSLIPTLFFTSVFLYLVGAKGIYLPSIDVTQCCILATPENPETKLNHLNLGDIMNGNCTTKLICWDPNYIIPLKWEHFRIFVCVEKINDHWPGVIFIEILTVPAFLFYCACQRSQSLFWSSDWLVRSVTDGFCDWLSSIVSVWSSLQDNI